MQKLKNKILVLLMFSFGISFSQTMYYLDSRNGSDANNGTSQNSPWKTLSKISSQSLNPGDQVLFKSGERFNGHFVVNGSGTETNPIIISSYGSGNKPILTGEVGNNEGGDYQEAIYVNNNDNMVFSGLEINNERIFSRTNIDDKNSYGIYIHNTGNQIMKNFTFRDITFQNIYAVIPILSPDDFNGLEVAALRFFSERNNNNSQKNIQDVIVEDSYFTNLQRLGIHIKHNGGNGSDDINRNKNFTIRNNNFYKIGGTCVLPSRTYNCLIENNIFNFPGDNSDPRMPNRGSAVWTWRCINTVIQKNECLHIRGYLDSHGIHIDHQNVNTFIQYNYMEDCEGGFVEILGGNLNSVYRFNVSVNDGWRENPGWVNSNHTIWINEKVPVNNIEYPDQNYIYNNTVVMNYEYSTAVDIKSDNTYIFNNIFYATNGANLAGKRVSVRINDSNASLEMKNNLFFGNINQRFKNYDSNPISGNPSFYNENSGDKYGYQLNVNSNAINNGIAMQGPAFTEAGKGIFKDVLEYPTEDFYGNPIDLSSGTPNIGACNAKNGEINLGTENLSINNKLEIIPNPVRNELILKQLSNSTNEIKIYNIYGQLVLKSRKKEKIDVSELSAGTYILSVDEKQLKFIKSN